MRPVLRKLIAMAYDRQVSDENFRKAVKNLISHRYIRNGTMEAMDRLWYDARIETERDRYVH